jgi:hypothetical protein
VGPRFPRAILTIALTLSAESADLARGLLARWKTPSTTVAEIEAAIADQPEG